MPINPISKVDRKGTLGSYYAVSNYTAINPEFGTMDDFKKLVRQIHEKGMKVVIDWVPNHTGADHPWLTAHPDFYKKDSTGKAATPFDWTDTRQLDYGSHVMQDSMIASMKFWITQTNIDGFRCDVAWNVPGSFWSRCITQLRTSKYVFMLAEGDSAYLPRSGFDAVYGWHMFHTMADIAAGKRNAQAIDSVMDESRRIYPPSTMIMQFTSDHDENSWNHADFGLFPRASHAPFAVLAMTLPGVPLIYSGQEEPILRALSFFEKDTIVFNRLRRAAFYHALLDLRSRGATGFLSSFTRLHLGRDNAVYAYLREDSLHKALVIVNLSPRPEGFYIPRKLEGHPCRDVFSGQKFPEGVSCEQPCKIAGWGYKVYEY
jgi:glycosidase